MIFYFSREQSSLPVCHLDHVVHQVELDHTLRLDHVVQHAGVNIAHGVAAAADDEALEKVDDLGWVEYSVVLPGVMGDQSQTLERIPDDH